MFTAGIWTTVMRTWLLSCMQLGAHRRREAVDGVLGPAVGALQRDAAVAERRADLDDGAVVSGPHQLERPPCRRRSPGS